MSIFHKELYKYTRVVRNLELKILLPFIPQEMEFELIWEEKEFTK